ncbi:MAG: transporter [Flammeovirgaceae bacterium]|nr:transporter [Flammeovirgaceae bacterium]
MTLINRPTANHVQKCTATALILFSTYALMAQDLDPRAYIKAPVKGTLLVGNLTHSEGGVLTDPTLPLENLEAKVQTVALGGVRTFSFFGQSAQALVILPFAFLDATASINGQAQSASRSGIADTRFRFSVLLLGGKAVTLEEFAKAKKSTIIGSSLTVIAPTGQYFSDKLINLGTWRWSFKPEIALTQPIGKRWMIDAYAGVWLFTNNNTFYPGMSVRRQDPLLTFQYHLSYNIRPRMWVALNATFYTGGQSSVNDTYKDDRLSNARIGGNVGAACRKTPCVKDCLQQRCDYSYRCQFQYCFSWVDNFLVCEIKSE